MFVVLVILVAFLLQKSCQVIAAPPVVTGGAAINYDVAFVWINKTKVLISENTKTMISTTLKQWKIDNPVPVLYLFLDYNYTLPEDIGFFSSLDYIAVRNIRDIFTIASEKLTALFDLSIPIYTRIDMAKILIKYYLLTQKPATIPYYVIMSDIDIKWGDLPMMRPICPKDGNRTPMQDFKEQSVFDKTTQKLLDYFGFVMAFDRGAPPENNFMIFKNDPDVIYSLKELFIDKIILNFLYDMLIKHIDVHAEVKTETSSYFLENKYSLETEYVHDAYILFYGYVNLIKKYQSLLYLDEHDTSNPLNNKVITTIQEFNDFNQNNQLFIKQRGSSQKFNNMDIILTSKGLDILSQEEFKTLIYPIRPRDQLSPGKEMRSFLCPSKCVMLEISTVAAK